jgi:hypothetical protein
MPPNRANAGSRPPAQNQMAAPTLQTSKTEGKNFEMKLGKTRTLADLNLYINSQRVIL